MAMFAEPPPHPPPPPHPSAARGAATVATGSSSSSSSSSSSGGGSSSSSSTPATTSTTWTSWLSSKRSPPPPAAAAPSAVSKLDRCRELQSTYGVRVGVSWGTLPLSSQLRWTTLGCDSALRGIRPMGDESSDAFTREYGQRHDSALNSREQSRRIQRQSPPSAVEEQQQKAAASSGSETGQQKLVVAVGACTTSRGFTPRGLEQLTLFNLMLPSLLRTLNTPATLNDPIVGVRGTEPLELWVYVTYDKGDAFYDHAEQEAAVRAWLDTHLVAPLRSLGVTAKHALLRFDNPLRKPGPAFNFMMAAAAEDGADYLYRVNDDTQFATAWLGEAVRTLRSFAPPNVGVVGPVCNEGNTNIMTHDLVHRTHLQIFDFYYPPILSDWWMDDWISKVYGPRRTRKGPWLVRHMVQIHGTRYDVDRAHERKLVGELDLGRKRLEQWLSKRATTAAFG